MSTLLDELAKQARSLALEERAQLAQQLMESVEQESDPDVQEAWESEVASRIAKYERGEAKLIPAEEVFAAARRLTRLNLSASLRRQRKEFLEQVAYYEEREKGLGERLRQAVEAATALASAHPNLGSPWKLRTR